MFTDRQQWHFLVDACSQRANKHKEVTKCVASVEPLNVLQFRLEKAKVTAVQW